MVRRILITAGLVLALTVGECRGDRIILKSGATYTGEVVETDASRVVFLAYMSGSETRLTFPRSAVRRIERSADGAGSDEDDAAERRRQEDERERAAQEEAARLEREARERANVVVATMHGAFGEEILPIGLERVIEAADERGAEYIVLDIDSSGGAVWAATRMMELIEESSDRFRFVAVVRRGISASIWPIFSSHDVFVLPRSEVGAAVIFNSLNGEVKAKFNSAAAATLGSVAETRGHSADVVRAMIIGPAELYVMERVGGKTEFYTTEPAASVRSPRVRRLDDAESVLTLTAQEMDRYGIGALLETGAGDELARALGASRWVESEIDASSMGRWAEECARRRTQTEELGTLLVQEVADFKRISGSGQRGAVDDMLDSTANLRRLITRYAGAANKCHECYPDFQEQVDAETLRETQLKIGEIQDAIRARRRTRD